MSSRQIIPTKTLLWACGTGEPWLGGRVMKEPLVQSRMHSCHLQRITDKADDVAVKNVLCAWPGIDTAETGTDLLSELSTPQVLLFFCLLL